MTSGKQNKQPNKQHETMENTLTIALEDYENLCHNLSQEVERRKKLEEQLDILSREKKQMVFCQTICVSPINNSTLWVDYEVLNPKDVVNRIEDSNKDKINTLEHEVEDLGKKIDTLEKDKNCYVVRLLAAENELFNLKSRNWWQRLWNKSK